MKKYLPLILLTLFTLSCQQSSSSTGTTTASESGVFGKISKEEFAKKIAEKKDVILIDVRTPEEFQNGTIQNALNINFYDKNFDAKITKLDKSKPIFVFCKSGGRSGKTLSKMKGMEFKEVYDLIGGYNGWKKH